MYKENIQAKKPLTRGKKYVNYFKCISQKQKNLFRGLQSFFVYDNSPL